MDRRSRLAGLRAAIGMALACGVMGLTASASSAAAPASVTDALGTHVAGLADAPAPGVRIPKAGGGCPHTDFWHTSGQVPLGPGWSALAIREGSCTASHRVGTHTHAFYKNYATHGQFICRGHLTYGYGTNTWYDDLTDRPYGWSWAGGTGQPFWDGSC